MDADGSNVHAAGSGYGNGVTPVWSPDGSRIYYVDYSGTTVYYTSSDGFTGTSASANTFHGGDISGGAPQLSADGSIMYYTDGGQNEVFSVPTSGTDTPTQLTNDTGGNGTDPSPVLADWSIKKFTVLGDSYSSGEPAFHLRHRYHDR